ncbi:MAG TPA: YraN family protein [Candidatus Limnocylindrales bacterium]|nr:YraN family protein [Candidatus Limnocylindrales bacterium]
MATIRQRRGLRAEEMVAAHLVGAGWSVLARNVRVGRDEIDLLCIDPGPPAELALVEVRSQRHPGFGPPEWRVDRNKVSHLYRAMATLFAGARVPGAGPLPRLPGRVDLVVLDDRGPKPVLRHLRRLLPP